VVEEALGSIPSTALFNSFYPSSKLTPTLISTATFAFEKKDWGRNKQNGWGEVWGKINVFRKAN
jgi:hypothetical protein